MSSTYYDPARAPNPEEWLALDEQERIRVAKNYHIAERTGGGDAMGHAVFHVAVENQIAQGHGPTCRTVERLQKEGLTRHDAIHAVGSVIAEFAYDSMHRKDNSSGRDRQGELSARIEALSARAWKGGGRAG